MTTLDVSADSSDGRLRVGVAGLGHRPPSGPCCCRDAYVLAHNLKEFLPRTILQPFLLVFVFTYVLPKIGLGIGGGPRRSGQRRVHRVADRRRDRHR